MLADKRRSGRLVVRMGARELAALDRVARRRGLKRSQLVRTLVLEEAVRLQKAKAK